LFKFLKVTVPASSRCLAYFKKLLFVHNQAMAKIDNI
jgi:hypothetical protein